MIADQELHKLFKAESEEHLARLDDGLLRLEETPADPGLLEEIFREAHSLKGAARMLGLARVEAAAHELESIFNAARKGQAPLTPESVERMNVGLADLRQRVQAALVDEPQSAQPPATELSHSLAIDEAVVGEPVAPPAPLAKPSASLHATPAVGGGERFRIETVRVETRKLDDLLIQVGELAVIQGQAQHRLKLMEDLLEQWAALERERREHKPGQPLGHDSGKEPRARFGSLLMQTRDALFGDHARLDSTVQRLSDQVGSMRLLPLSTLFASFPRMVRDLAGKQGKEVELMLEGGNITVDKRILEEMKDPLMHLIRNAVDHGIEPPDERTRLGKPPRAMIRLGAAREDGYVLVEVRDDGRGLDVEEICREASERGLLEDGERCALAPQQLQQLIFTSGFSTSGYVTEVSGRGVGLDVVRVNVERLKGTVDLESHPGRGLAVRLRLPLSLATTRLLLARSGGRLYGLPVEFIKTSRRVYLTELFTVDGCSAVLLDGQPLIVARLADLLELPAASEGGRQADATPGPKTLACVVLQVGHGRLGLLTDELTSEAEVVSKPLSAPLKRVRNVSSLAMLGSGEICAVLNPADLLLSAGKSISAPPVKPSEIRETRQATRPAVLLAEDSALIRAMEKRILEDAHYEVVTAVDGVDALNLLGSRTFSAVVTDIVMPNMDGLTLTARIRAEPRHRNLPVVLVTSLASDEDKRRGLDVGANAYIPKPTFDQNVLLDTLRRLVGP